MVREGERRGEGLQLCVVDDIFTDAGVVAAWIKDASVANRLVRGVCVCVVYVCEREMEREGERAGERRGTKDHDVPARTRRTPSRSLAGSFAKARIARPMSFFRSNRLMLRINFLPPRTSA